jgi:hypothetical protein
MGCVVDCFALTGITKVDGHLAKDLNDLSSMNADAFVRDRELWSVLP